MGMFSGLAFVYVYSAGKFLIVTEKTKFNKGLQDFNIYLIFRNLKDVKL